MMKAGSLAGPFFGVWLTKGKDESKIQPFVDAVHGIEKWFTEKSSTNYVMGTDHPTIVDLDLYPIIARVKFLEGSVLHWIYEKIDFDNKCPKLLAFFNAIYNDPLFQEAKTQRNAQVNFTVD